MGLPKVKSFFETFMEKIMDVALGKYELVLVSLAFFGLFRQSRFQREEQNKLFICYLSASSRNLFFLHVEGKREARTVGKIIIRHQRKAIPNVLFDLSLMRGWQNDKSLHWYFSNEFVLYLWPQKTSIRKKVMLKTRAKVHFLTLFFNFFQKKFLFCR